MMESMLSNEKWSLRPWKKTLEDQLGSWLMYVPGMRDASETKQLTSFKGMAFFSMSMNQCYLTLCIGRDTRRNDRQGTG